MRSVLNPTIIEEAAQVSEKILEEEALEEDDNDDDDERSARSYGSLISWSHTDQIGSLGILYIILALSALSLSLPPSSCTRTPTPAKYAHANRPHTYEPNTSRCLHAA